MTERIRKAGGSHHLDLQGVSFSQLIEHIRELDRDHYPRTSDYRYQEPRSLSECDKAVAALIVEAVMLAFDFGSLPLVATDNARAAVESVIPLIDAELGYFRRLVALIGDTTASAPSRAVAVVQLLFGTEVVELITTIVKAIIKSFGLLDGVFFGVKLLAKLVLGISTDGALLLISSMAAILGDTAHVVFLAVAVGKTCGAAGKGVVTTVAGGHEPGPAANQLNSPRGVALDASGNLYVADASNCRVQKIAPGADTATTVVAGVPAQQWSNINSFGFLEGLAVDSQQNLYVLSSTYNWVQTFNPGPHNPVFSGFYTGDMKMGAMFGGDTGSGSRQFAGPQDVAVDSEGSVYVSDAGNNRVQKFAQGSKDAVTVTGGANPLSGPTGIAIDANGNLYVCDSNNHRVLKFVPGSKDGVIVAGGTERARRDGTLSAEADGVQHPPA